LCEFIRDELVIESCDESVVIAMRLSEMVFNVLFVLINSLPPSDAVTETENKYFRGSFQFSIDTL